MLDNCHNLQAIQLNGYIDWTNYTEILIAQASDDDYDYYIHHIYGSNILWFSKAFNLFKNCFSLKELDLFFINIKYQEDLSLNKSKLKGCLFNDFEPNIIECTDYIGFHHCGNCINNNIDFFCTK